MIKRYTKIDVSSRTFDVSDINSIGAKLEQLTRIKEFDRVNVRVKIIDVKKKKKNSAGGK